MFRIAMPIWQNEEARPDEYMECREILHCPQNNKEPVILRIAADSDYTVYLNGALAAFGQFANYPFRRVFDEIDVTRFLTDGENELRIITWYIGIDSSTYRRGTAFLSFELERDGKILAASGKETQCREVVGYLPHRGRMISGQLGPTYAYDLTDGGDRPYHNAVLTKDLRCEWVPRPVERLTLCDRLPVELTQQGVFSMPHYAGMRETHAEADMQFAALSFRYLPDLTDPIGYDTDTPTYRKLREHCPRTLCVPEQDRDHCNGLYVIVDLGAETAGFLDFDLEVPYDCDMEVGYGEHLHDGRCRTSRRNFTAIFRLRAGRNSFLNTFRRFGCRYLQFFIFASSVTLHYAGLRPTVYPVHKKQFRCGNLLRETIYEVAQDTLLHCMHEHYEDCPGREQALYAMDSRNQMLCGYDAFGETRFARASLELISYGMREDGLLMLCYPAGTDLPIPSFSLVWVIAMREYIEHTGDCTLAEERFAVLERLMETFARNCREDGLLNTFRDKHATYWNFYEWSETMSDDDRMLPSSPEAPLNAFYVLALDSMASICRSLGREDTVYRMRAEQLRPAIAAQFYRPSRRLFASFTDRAEDRYSVLTNALCLLCGAADALPDRTELLRVLAANGEGMPDCIPNTLSMNSFRFDALLREDRSRYAPIILDELDRVYLYMLRRGATSFWETIHGEADFGDAGSLCHGWSALVIHYYETLLKAQNV